jgi:hypothetical protein
MRASDSSPIREPDLKKLAILSSSFTVNDCVRFLSCADKLISKNRQSVWREATSLAIDRLVSVLKQSSQENLGSVMLSLSKLRSNRAPYYLEAVMGSLGRASIQSLEFRDRVLLLHALGKVSLSADFVEDILNKCIEDNESWDHKTGSLLAAFVCRLNRSPSELLRAFEAFSVNQKDRLGEWTPQSIALYVLSVSKLVKTQLSNPMKTFIMDLASAASPREFTDQNACNLVVGLSNLSCDVPEPLVSNLLARKLKTQDIVFLLKSRDPKIAEMALANLAPSLSPTEAIAVCDVGSINHADLIARYLDVQYIDDIEAAFYVMNKLNHRPPILKSFHIPDSLSGHKASQILSAMSKLDIKDLPTVRMLVNRVLRDSTKSSDVAKSIFSATCLIKDDKERIGLLRELLTCIRIQDLNMIDKRQLMRAACILFQTSGDINDNLIDVLIRLHALSADVSPEKVPAPSRAQLQVKATVSRIVAAETESLREEVLVPSISSYIDILVCPR